MTKTLRPGVVTGEDYRQLLAACKDGGYALPAVNIVGTNSINAVLETAAKAMREQDERKESIFRQSVEAEKNKEDLFEKKFAEALRKAKDAPDGKPLREFDLD